MRKLLVLAAILFIAPIAAGMTVSLNNTGTTVELSVFDEPEVGIIAMVIEDPGLLTNFVDGPQAPMSFLFETVTINGDLGQWRQFLQRPPLPEGVWLIADFSASVPVRVSAYRGYVVGRDEYLWLLMDQIYVPEPTTIALLALGGLLIIRNRRR